MADKESTLVVKVDGSQAEAGVASVKRSLHDLADTASREGQRGAAGIAGVGAGAEKSAAQIERSTQRQIGEIRRMTAELESGGKATRAYQEAMASIRGVDTAALRPYLDQLEQARTRMAGLGATSVQTANQMRMVAPQITDIVTQLASGQSAFTIFIQQGGQLKDMFGGVGNAAKAIGTYVLGLVNPFTLAAGAAALLATAYYQGSKESAAYNTAIAMSGNAAGVTAGQLGDMARAMQSATRTQSASSAALAEMAQNSRVGSDELQRYTAVAMDFEKVTGTAVSKTAEAFASLAKEPLQAAIKLNDGVNWLTTSTYEHVKSLEEQGRKTDAARVAQEAYANSVAQKTAQLQGNLGALERGWNSLAGAAKSAWSAMLNIGRSETLGDQLNNARASLDARMQRGPINEGVRGAWETGNERLKQQIALLSEQERMLKRGAEAQAAANAQVQARISLDSKYGDKLKTDSQKAKAARDEIAELGKAAGKSADEIKKLQAASDATFNRGGGGGRKGGGAGRTSAAPGENEIARIKTMIEEEQRYIAALQERGKEAEKLTAGEKLVLKLQQELQTSMSGVAKANKEKALAAAQELVAVEKTRISEEKRIKTDEEARKRLIASIDEERAARMKLAEENAKRVDSIGKENERMREEIETLGLSAAQIAARTIEINNATIAEKENQLASLQNDNISTREMAALEEEIKMLKERNGLLSDQGVKEQYVAAQQEITDTWVSIDRTAHDTFVNIFEDGAGTFKRLGQTLKAALLDMLYQMTVKRWIINIGASLGATGGIFAAGNAVAGQGAGATNLLGGLGNLFGGSAAGAGGFGGFMGLGSFGSGFGAGLGALFGEAGLMGGLSAGATAIGAGNILGGLGTLAGVAAPILGPLALLGLSGAFSRKHEQHNLQGTFGGASGFEGNWHDYYKGGLFRSSKTVDTPIEAGFLKQLRDAWKTQESAVQGYAKALGLATGKIDGFTYSINLKLKDIDVKDENAYQQAVMQRVSEAIRAGSNEMAQMLIGSWESVTETVARTVQTYGDEGGFGEIEETIERRTYKPSEFARDGEQAIDTLTRLATSLQGVNGMFDTLGLTLYEASLKGGDMASQLADAAGGLDKLQASGAAYFQAFYTGSEQYQTALRQLQEQMTRMGVETIPYTREQFRALVESLDLTTEEGRKMYAALLGISEAFAAVTPELFQAGQSLSDAIAQGLLGTFNGGDLGAYMAQTVTDGIYSAVAGYFAQQITDIMLQGVINPMIQAAITGSSVSAAVSQASIDAMVAQANAVASAAAAVMNDPAFQAAMASIGQAVGSIKIPAVRASSSVSTYTAAVRDSGGAADEAAREAERLADAWRSIGDTLIDEVNRIRGVVADAGGNSLSYYQSLFAVDTAAARAGDQDAAGRLSGLSGDLLRAAEAQADSLFELQQMRAWVAQSLQDTAGYAYGRAGGTVPGATPAPVTTPFPAIFSRAPAQQDNGARELNQQIAVLTEQNQRQSAQLADLQLQLLRVFRRWDDEGMPPQREEEGVTP